MARGKSPLPILQSLPVAHRRRNFAKIKIDPATLADHLEWTLFAGKDRETQNLLTIDHSLDRSATLSFSQESVHIDETADVIRVVLRPAPARLPKVPVVGRSADEAALHRYRAIV